MNFVVLRNEGRMSIDNATVELDTASLLPSPNIEIFTWRGEAGSGFIEYNDRLRITEKISDLIPYRYLVDAWLNVAFQQSAITLPQAQNVKLDMVEAIYQNKRIASYLHSPSGWLYEGTDEAVAYMSALVASTGIYNRANEVGGEIDGAFTRVAGAVNDNIVAPNNASASHVNGWSGMMHTWWAGLDQIVTDAAGGSDAATPSGALQHSHAVGFNNRGRSLNINYVSVGSGFPNTMSGIAATDTSVGGGVVGTVTWQPLNALSPQSINAIHFKDALRGIMERRRANESARALHKRTIPQLGSVPAVIGHDVAIWWP